MSLPFEPKKPHTLLYQPTSGHERRTSWLDVFPEFTNDFLESYAKKASEEERAVLASHLEVKKVYGQRESESEHVLSVSLFCKHLDDWAEDIPVPTLASMKTVPMRGGSVYNRYVAPLLAGAKRLSTEMTEVRVRVYLAADLAFLMDELVEFCEVRLMVSSSVRAMPGMLWRYLAFEDHDGLVTVLDSDMVGEYAVNWLNQTKELKSTDYGSWRVVASKNEIDQNNFLVYRPMMGGVLGSRIKLPMRGLLEAFLWHSFRGNLPTHTVHPTRGEKQIFNTHWPNYGFDEWFLLMAVYPRLARLGFASHGSMGNAWLLLPLDIAFQQERNPASKVFFELKIKPKVLVGVCSCRKHQDKRQAVRETWLASKPENIEVLFFVGNGEPLEDEPDTISLTSRDDYAHLPQKVGDFFRYALKNHDFDYLFKCDDDTYVCLERLTDLTQEGADLLGNYFITERGSPSGGAGYLLKRELVGKLAHDTEIPATGDEDVIYGQAAMVRHQAKCVASDRLIYDHARFPRPDNDLISAHWCSPAKLAEIDSHFRVNDHRKETLVHDYWKDEVFLYQTGRFCRKSTACAGDWKEKDNSLILTWDEWDEEVFARPEANGEYKLTERLLKQKNALSAQVVPTVSTQVSSESEPSILVLFFHHRADELTWHHYQQLLEQNAGDGKLEVVPICFPEYAGEVLRGTYVPKNLLHFRLNRSAFHQRFFHSGMPILSDLDCLIWDFVLFGGRKFDRIVLAEGDMLSRCSIREFFRESFAWPLTGSLPRLGIKANQAWSWYCNSSQLVRDKFGENVASVTPVCGIQMDWELAEAMAVLVFRSKGLFDDMHVELVIPTLARMIGVDVKATVVPKGFRPENYMDFRDQDLKVGPWGLFHPVKSWPPKMELGKEHAPPLTVLTLWRAGWSPTQAAVLKSLEREDFPERTQFLWTVAPGSDTEQELSLAVKSDAWIGRQVTLLRIQTGKLTEKHSIVTALYNHALLRVESSELLMIEDDVLAEPGTYAVLKAAWEGLPETKAACMVGYRSRTRTSFFCAGDIHTGYVPLGEKNAGPPRMVNWVGGGYTLYQSEAVNACLPLKSKSMGDYFIGWDVDLCERLRAGKRTIYLTTKVCAEHCFESTQPQPACES